MAERLVFLGSDPIALPLLEWLAGEGRKTVQLAGVFTQPDRPAGRGQAVAPNAIKSWALDQGIPVRQPEKLTESEREEFAAMRPDIALVLAYGHIMRDPFIATPRIATLNLHASLLPRYRGASPIQTAVAGGEKTTGVSLMRIVRQLDAGPVADRETVLIGSLDTAREVEAKLGSACVPLVERTLAALARGELNFVEQDPALATYCRRLNKEDGALDFAASAGALAARINGLFPWPGCTAMLNGQTVKLGLADLTVAAPAETTGTLAPAMGAPGTVLGADPEGLLVATGEGTLRLRQLQRPGGRMLPAGDFLRGFPVAAGTVIPSAPMRPLVSSSPVLGGTACPQARWFGGLRRFLCGLDQRLGDKPFHLDRLPPKYLCLAAVARQAWRPCPSAFCFCRACSLPPRRRLAKSPRPRSKWPICRRTCGGSRSASRTSACGSSRSKPRTPGWPEA